MAVQTQSFTTFVSNAVSAIQGAATALVDLTVGSILRAAVEAVSAIALWLQGIALQIAALTRFATSTGSDADSFAADFGFSREPAVASEGPVTLARFTPTAQAIVPIGDQVQTADGTQIYTIIADTTQSAYNPTLEAYVIPASTASITVTVQNTVPGAAGNVGAGIINTLSQAITGVDTVTNAAPFTDGANAQSDAAFRTAFVAYLATLADGTVAACEFAVESLQIGAQCEIIENQNYAGQTDDGYFCAIVDDGSGAPSSNFLSSAFNAINAVRPVTISFGVFPPVIEYANVSMTLTTSANYTHSTCVALAVAALESYIDALPDGTELPYSILASIAYAASPGITNVTNVLLNSGTADLTCTVKQVIKAGTVAVS